MFEEEMIGLLDIDEIVKAFRVTIADAERECKLEYVMDYLNRWSKEKSWLYEKFGHKLILEESVELQKTAAEIGPMVDDLCIQFPAYAATIKSIDVDDYAKNEFTEDGFLCKFFPETFKKRCKVSKALSALFKDEQFDISLSKILQNRTISGTVAMSIHPLDYITMSTTKHNWGSCMDIVSGFNKTGGFSLMMDDSSIIAYQSSGTTTYSCGGASFKWNNKTFRQIIIVGDDKKSFAFGHSYKCVDDACYKKWVGQMKEVVDSGGEWGKRVSGNKQAEQVGAFYYDTNIKSEYCTPEANRGYRLGVRRMKCVECGKDFDRILSYEGWLVHKEHCGKK